MQLSRRRSAVGTSLSDINITPFVDVVLVLLIIFMITAPVLQSGIEVELPKTKTVKAIAEERLVVTIDRSERLYLGNNLVNVNQLGEVLQAKMPAGAQSVFVRCDESVPFGIGTLRDLRHRDGHHPAGGNRKHQCGHGAAASAAPVLDDREDCSWR
jgi:biopolymer transport protein ExbD/biopolymer transport protein TolR